MVSTASTKLSNVIDVEFTLPDATNAARTILASALEFCAQKTRLDCPETVLERLQQGDPNAGSYFAYGLAVQVAEHLGALDDEVKAVYLYDDEATPEDAAFGEMTSPLVHLIVCAKRKTGALNSLIAGLDRAVVYRYAELLGRPQFKHLLDIQLTDDAEVNTRTGYGAMLSWLHHRPLLVWKRQSE